MTTRRALLLAAALLLLCTLYLTNLSTMGLVSTDEPRYADIGRAMARTGDWITPRLWGHPWFEKPALLYWMIAAGFEAGLGPEVAPRLPVALLSLLFLAFFWLRLRVVWDEKTASFATAMLATSAGWLAVSRVAITDIPMAVFFSAAVLLALDGEGDHSVRGRKLRLTSAGALLGFATLAKSLPPMVFFLPVWAFDYRRLRDWLRPAPVAAFLTVSIPWHILCAWCNGGEFLRVLFVEHQFGRFVSPQLQHVQPWWYFMPVLPLLLFPWFPLLALLPRDFRDRRVRVVAAVAAFGFVFLSLSRNKLPTYLLPLVPCFCVLMALGLSRWQLQRPESRRPALAVAFCAALLAILPLAAQVLPTALATGLHTATIPWRAIPLWLGAGGVAGAGLSAIAGRNRMIAVAALASLCLIGFNYKIQPEIDRVVSARPLWRATHPDCVPELHRRLLYGLAYYAGRELPQCDILNKSVVPVVR